MMNTLLFAVPIADDDFLESSNFLAEMLRGVGIKGQKKESIAATSIPRLVNNSYEYQSHRINPSTQSYSTDTWTDTRWKYRKNITIDHNEVSGSGNLLNFPVLIDLIDSDLKNNVQVDGGDIFFTNTTGYKLDHEIELLDRHYSSSEVHLVAWVRIPSLSSSVDTTISMYYSNPTAANQENPEGVWDNNYTGVWHMREAGLDTRYDSTSSDNSGSPSDYDGDEATTGKIGGDDDLDGTNDNLIVQNSNSLNITNALTIEAWIEDDAVDRKRIVTKGGEIYVLRTDLSGRLHGYLMRESTLYHVRSVTNLITSGTYHHVVFTWDGISGDHNLRLFHNGAEIGSYATQDSVSSPLVPETSAKAISSPSA